MVTLFSREPISRRWFVHVGVSSGADYSVSALAVVIYSTWKQTTFKTLKRG